MPKSLSELIELVPVERLSIDKLNVRKHDDRSIGSICASLKEFGQQRPIIANRKSGIVLAGNGLLLAAQKLGMKEVIVRWTDLTGHRARAYAVADNRTSDLSEWDMALLKDVLQELDAGDFVMDATGWNNSELEQLMTQFHVGDEQTTGTTRADTKATYDASSVRQIVLILNIKEYEKVCAALMKICKTEKLETNTEAVQKLIAFWQKNHGK